MKNVRLYKFSYSCKIIYPANLLENLCKDLNYSLKTLNNTALYFLLSGVSANKGKEP